MTRIGPTGEPPISHRPNDGGGLNAALTCRDGLIHLDFGAHVSFVVMTPAEARDFAVSLIRKAQEIENA